MHTAAGLHGARQVVIARQLCAFAKPSPCMLASYLTVLQACRTSCPWLSARSCGRGALREGVTEEELAFWGGDLLQEAGMVFPLRAPEAHCLEEGHGLFDGSVKHQEPVQQINKPQTMVSTM